LASRAPAHRRRLIPRSLPVNLPPLHRSQDSAERITLPQARSFLRFIEQNVSDLRPRTLQDDHPFLRRDVPFLDPSRTNLLSMREPCVFRIAVDPRCDAARHHEAAMVDARVRLHGFEFYRTNARASVISRRYRTPSAFSALQRGRRSSILGACEYPRSS